MRTTTIEYIKFWLCAFAISIRITKCRDITKQIASATVDKLNDELESGKQIDKPYGWIATVCRRDSIAWVNYHAIYADTTADTILELLGTSNHFKKCEEFLTDFQKPLMADFLESMVDLFESYPPEKQQVIYYHFTTKKKSYDIADMVEGMTPELVRQTKHRVVRKFEKLIQSYENQLPKDLMREQFEIYLRFFYEDIEGNLTDHQTTN